MIEITGGCHKCGLPTTYQIGSVNFVTQANYNTGEFNLNPKIICPSCYEKHYSKKAIRDKKLEQLLYKPWWKKILNIK